MVNNLIKQKKAWVKLMEVFLSIVLIVGVVLILPNVSNFSGEKAQREEILSKEVAILRDIQLNDTLRTEIFAAGLPPIEWQGFETSLPLTQTRIIALTPSNYKCEAKICDLTSSCILEMNTKNSVYAQAVVFSADSTTYSPRQLKLFCSQKE